MTTSASSKNIPEKDTGPVKHSPKEFNFNPQEKEASSFLSHIFLQMFEPNELTKLREKQEKLNILCKEIKKVVDPAKKKQHEKTMDEINCVLRLAVSEKIQEKIKFTFTGFDISKKSIPSDLIKPSENILEDKTLSLLAKSYLTAQIYSIFEITNHEFENLSRKGRKNRSDNEELKYAGILKLLGKVVKIEKLLKDPGKNNNNLNSLLEEIEKDGKEGKEMYGLLKPLASLLYERSLVPKSIKTDNLGTSIKLSALQKAGYTLYSSGEKFIRDSDPTQTREPKVVMRDTGSPGTPLNLSLEGRCRFISRFNKKASAPALSDPCPVWIEKKRIYIDSLSLRFKSDFLNHLSSGVIVKKKDSCSKPTLFSGQKKTC